jgi:hypothetical protein
MLSRLGRRDDALAAANEAAGIYRDLARERPEAFTPRTPDLAAHSTTSPPGSWNLGDAKTRSWPPLRQ